MTSRFCRWKPCGEVQSFGGKFCTRHTCGGGLDGDCTNKIAFEGAERCIHHKCSVVDCTATKLDYADVNYCLTHYQGRGGGPSSTSLPNLSTQETVLKDEPCADMEEPEELAGLDSASTALVIYDSKGKDQFSDSVCRDSYCNEPATGESPYCRLHKCWRGGCNAQRVFEARVRKWSQGCGNHNCRYKGCLSVREKGSDYCAGHLQPCKVYNCPRRAHSNGPWCNFHRLCKNPDCANKRMSYSAYCSLHGCTKSPGCTSSKSTCTRHLVNRPAAPGIPTPAPAPSYYVPHPQPQPVHPHPHPHQLPHPHQHPHPPPQAHLYPHHPHPPVYNMPYY